MADIRHRISLEGGDQVLGSLKGIGDEGERSGQRLKRSFEGSVAPTDAFKKFHEVSTKTFSEVGGRAGEMAKKFREAIHVLHGAGIESGALGALGTAARVGAGGLAVAGIGATLIALEKAANSRAEQMASLAALVGSPAAGRAQFGRLRQTAEKVELPTEPLAGPYTELLRISQGQKQQIAPKVLQNALQSLFEGAAVSKVAPDKASEGITALLGSISDSGRLTPEAASAAGKIMPALMDTLLKELSKQHPNAGSYTGPEVVKGLSDVLPELKERREATEGAFGTTISEEWTKLRASLDRLSETLGAPKLLSEILRAARLTTDVTTKGLEANKEAGRAGGGGSAAVASGSLGLSSLLIGGVVGALNDKGKSANDRVSDAFGQIEKTPNERVSETFKQLAGALDPATGGLKSFAEGTKNATQVLEDFTKRNPEASVALASSGVSKEQARINYKYAPEETELKLGEDKLAVDKAKLNERSTKLQYEESQKNIALAAFAQPEADIAVKDAKKNFILSMFAPGDAQLAVHQADTSVSQAAYNYQKLSGNGDKDQEESLARAAASDAIEAAQRRAQKARVEAAYSALVPQQAAINYQKAQVQAKYAYLAPQTAEVQGQKALQDIRGAEFLRKHSELTLAKDDEGKQLPTDVAALNYASATLDEEKKANATGLKSSAVLEQILGALKGKAKSGDVTEAHAGGGLIRGPGTGTSDSILARLSGGGQVRVSNGEYVMKQAAVSHWGVGKMDAINNLESFAVGGLIGGDHDISLGSFAEGGKIDTAKMQFNAGLHPVPITLPGGAVANVFAAPDAVGALQHYSAMAVATRTGVSPSWRRS